VYYIVSMWGSKKWVQSIPPEFVSRHFR